MKNNFLNAILLSLGLTLSLSLAAQPAAPTPPSSGTGSGTGGDPEHSGVAGGGAGGIPVATTVKPTGIGTTSIEPTSIETSSFGTTSVGTNNYTETLAPTRRPSGAAAKEVLLNRRQMLDAIDTALSANDLTLKTTEGDATVRILSVDLKSATIRGRILETNQSVLLIEKAKQAAARASTIAK